MRTGARWTAGVVVLAAVSAAVALLYPDAAPRNGGHDAPEEARAAPALLYLKGSRLRRLDLATGADRLLRRIPRADVQAAPAGGWLAVVSAAESEGETDFAAKPRLTLLDPASGVRRRLGMGVSPLWQPDGDVLAYLRPVENRACVVESCSGAAEVVVVEAGSGKQETLLEAARWSLLAWAGDRLLVADLSDPTRITAVSHDGRRQSLGLSPGELWGASPDGRWVVVSRPPGAAFVAIEGGSSLGDPRPLSLDGRTLAEGSWSSDSSEVAAVVLRLRPGGIPRSRLTISSPDRPVARPVESSRGAVGLPLWSPDGSAVLFTQAAGPGGRRLRARLCILETSACRSLMSWTDDVRLLRLE